MRQLWRGGVTLEHAPERLASASTPAAPMRVPCRSANLITMLCNLKFR